MENSTISNSLLKKIWMIFGASLLFTMTIFFAGIFDMEYIKYLAAWQFLMLFIWPFSGVIIPGLFIFSSIKAYKKYFLPTFVSVVTFTMFLDIYWISSGWKYGLNYQGINFLSYSVIANSIAFVLIYALLGTYYKTKKIIYLQPAILFFFITISVIAFPWLGERM